jgi:hypothetical protein
VSATDADRLAAGARFVRARLIEAGLVEGTEPCLSFGHVFSSGAVGFATNVYASAEGRAFLHPDPGAACAVADEHAVPLLAAPTFTVTRSTRPIEVPAIDIHRERTKHLGAHRFSRNEHSAITLSPADSAAWSAHLRHLVKQSAQRDAAQAPRVGWDPFGDDA